MRLKPSGPGAAEHLTPHCPSICGGTTGLTVMNASLEHCSIRIERSKLDASKHAPMTMLPRGPRHVPFLDSSACASRAARRAQASAAPPRCLDFTNPLIIQAESCAPVCAVNLYIWIIPRFQPTIDARPRLIVGPAGTTLWEL